MEHYGTLWDIMDHCGSLWDIVDHCGTLWMEQRDRSLTGLRDLLPGLIPSQSETPTGEKPIRTSILLYQILTPIFDSHFCAPIWIPVTDIHPIRGPNTSCRLAQVGRTRQACPHMAPVGEALCYNQSPGYERGILCYNKSPVLHYSPNQVQERDRYLYYNPGRESFFYQ